MTMKFQLPSRIVLIWLLAIPSSRYAFASPGIEPDVLPDAVVPNGVSLVPEDTLRAFRVTGSQESLLKVSYVPDSRLGTGEVLRAQTVEKPLQSYGCQLAVSTVAPVARGDLIAASFWMRKIESSGASGTVGFVFEGAAPPYLRSIGVEKSAGPDWKRVDIYFAAANPFAPGEAVANLRLGYAPQTVEIGAFALKDLGPEPVPE